MSILEVGPGQGEVRAENSAETIHRTAMGTRGWPRDRTNAAPERLYIDGITTPPELHRNHKLMFEDTTLSLQFVVCFFEAATEN